MSFLIHSAFQYKPKSKPPELETKNHAADTSNFENKVKTMKGEISKLILKVTDLQSKLSLTCECFKEEVEMIDISETSQNTLMKQLTEAKKKRDSFKSKLSACVEILSNLLTRNINNRTNTQQNHVAFLKQTVAS